MDSYCYIKRKFYTTLKNIQKAIILNFGIEHIEIKINLNDTSNIEDLEGIKIFCQLFKINVLDSRFFIETIDSGELNFYVGDKRFYDQIFYNSWTKVNDEDFHRLSTAVSPKSNIKSKSFLYSIEEVWYN